MDAAAPLLASLKQPIVIAKVNADKYTSLARKYEVEYVLKLTLKLFFKLKPLHTFYKLISCF